jgi:hypothetical protein
MKILIVLIKSSLVIALLMFSTHSALAHKKIDIITLKNGNILKGKIIRQVLGDFVELETRDNNFWKFDMENIADIRFKTKRRSRVIADTITKPSKGMFYEIKMGVLVGNKGNQNNAPFSMILSGSYRLNQSISAGAGIGYEAFSEAQMPVFGEIKYHTNINGIQSYIFCQSGYSFPLENRDNRNYYFNTNDNIDSEGGWLINPGVGIVFGNKSRTNFTLNIGYRFQRLEHKWHNSNTDDMESLKEEFNRLSIHLGIIF